MSTRATMKREHSAPKFRPTRWSITLAGLAELARYANAPACHFHSCGYLAESTARRADVVPIPVCDHHAAICARLGYVVELVP